MHAEYAGQVGCKEKNIWLCDINGLVYEGRTTDMNAEKAAFAQKTDLRSLDEVIENADMFLGLSGPNILTSSMIKKMGASQLYSL